MRERESQLREITGTNSSRTDDIRWEDLSKGEKFAAGLIYTNFVVAPIVNLAIYAGFIGAVIYCAVKY